MFAYTVAPRGNCMSRVTSKRRAGTPRLRPHQSMRSHTFSGLWLKALAEESRTRAAVIALYLEGSAWAP